MNLYEAMNITNTVETPHSITLIANNGEQKVFGRLTDEQLKQFVELFIKLGVTPSVEQKTRATLAEQSKTTAPAPAPKKSYKGKASAPKKDKPFWSYVENAPLTGSVKLDDFYEVTSSKSGHQAVIEVSKELPACWWYFMNAVIREYNSTIDAEGLFPLKSYNHKIYCDRKLVNSGTSFMFADSVQSTESLNKFIEVLNGYLTKTGKTSVKKAQAVYAKADAERKAEHEARKGRKAQA